jgi:hypothetical protein
MPRNHRADPLDAGPTPIDLQAIEAEWPVIAAELELLDAQLLLIIAGGHASTLDRRRVRRAARRLLAIRRAAAGERRSPASPDLGGAA